MDPQTLLNDLSEFGFTYIRIKRNDKRPVGKWSRPEDRITADEAVNRIAKGGNYGIVPPDGVFILDFDSDEAYRQSIAKESSIERSLTFKTPRGYHVVFEGDGVEQGAGHTFLGESVDIRSGNRGYVVGPGSTRDGKRYEYLHGDEIAECPESLRSLLQKPRIIQEHELPGRKQRQPESAPQSPVEASSGTSEGRRPLSIPERGAASRKHWQALEGAQPGERNDTIARAACGLGSIYADAPDEKREQIYARLIEHAERLGDDDSDEIKQNRTTARNQWEKGAETPASRIVKQDNSDRYRITFDQFGSHEFEEALANLNIEVRSNEGRQQIEFRIVDNGSWSIPQAFRFKVDEWFVPDKKTAESLMYYLNQYFGKEKGDTTIGVSIVKEKFWQWVSGIASKNAINPFREWVNQCSPNPELEGLTLENWLDPWMVDRDSEMNRWTARAIMVGIVQNVYGDSQPCRVIPVLRGEKGIGKTTLVSHLIPEEFRYHFGQFHVRRKAEMVGSIVGKYLCEFGELDGMGDTKVSAFKEFIGNLVNTARLPWEPQYLDYRNQALIIGTSNPERNVPNDEALRSRLVFMDLRKAHDPKEYLPDRLNHLYALAREAYFEGERVDVIPEHFESEQQEASEESVIVNQVIDDKLRMIDWRQFAEWFTVYDILLAAGLITQRSSITPSGALKAVRGYLDELGVGTARKNMKKKGPARRWHYHESERIRQIRAAQVQEYGTLAQKYGHGVNGILSNLSELD